jgi:hypothetical protein
MSDQIKRFTAISSATLVAELATLPICTIKTNYQNASLKHPTTINQTVKNMIANSGYRAFWSATGTALCSQMLSTSIKYVLYKEIDRKINNPLLSGLSAGIAASLITHPIDLIKVNKQMQTEFLPKLKATGPKIFYQGYSKTFLKYSVGGICFLPIRDKLIPYIGNGWASFSSAVISTIITQPFDYMKIRQTYGLPFFSGYNPISYYKGLSLNLLRVVPHFTIMMMVADKIEKLLGLAR